MKKFLFAILFCCGWINHASSTHIAGGDFTVQWISGNNFQVTLKLFRDCASGGAGFDNPINITVFDNVTNGVVQTFQMFLQSGNQVVLGDECYSPPASVCIQEGIYTAQVTLANNPNGYYMAWERCCRNPTIQNIAAPGNSGMVFYVQVPDPAIQNSTPTFGAYPAEGYLCQGVLNTIDFDVTEADGDSLVYSLIDPLMGSLSTVTNPAPNSANPKPYVTINWQAPYSLADIVGGTPVMSVDPQTGIITCTPTGSGVFVFAVMIEEFRNGVKISESIRDIQYYVLNCVFDDLPEILLPDTVEIAVSTTGCFDIVVLDDDATDTISILVTSPVTFADGATVGMPAVPVQTFPDTTYMFYYTHEITGLLDSVELAAPVDSGGAFYGIGGIGLHYCWETSCADIIGNPYILDVAAFSLGCSGDTNFINQTVHLVVVTNPPPAHEIFMPDTISVVASSAFCFDIVVLSTDPSDTLNVVVTSPTFAEGAGLSMPAPFQTVPDTLYYFNYVDNGMPDSVLLPRPFASNNVYTAEGGVGLQYCWQTSCIDAINGPFEIDVTLFEVGCFGDTSFVTHTAVVEVVPGQLPAQEIILPDTITIVAQGDACFDAVVLSQSPNDTINVQVYSSTFGEGAVLTQPTPVSTNPTMYQYYFWNNFVLDSVILAAPTQSGNTFTGIGGVGLHYCWHTECEHITPGAHQITVGAFRLGCLGDTTWVYNSAYVHVDPPVGEPGMVPNVFSPNGDNLNDVFKLGGLLNYCYDTVDVTIYNRWGQELFHSNDPVFTWNGTNQKGEDVPEGIYFVVLRGIFGDADVTRHFQLHLFRNK